MSSTVIENTPVAVRSATAGVATRKPARNTAPTCGKDVDIYTSMIVSGECVWLLFNTGEDSDDVTWAHGPESINTITK